jgi:hypothetical protein
MPLPHANRKTSGHTAQTGKTTTIRHDCAARAFP